MLTILAARDKSPALYNLMGAAINADDNKSDGARSAALARYNILDTPRESDFDDIVKIAAEICGTPISLISLIDHDRQWFKAETGVGIRETPLDQSMCRKLMNLGEVSVISDALQDPRFDDNSLIHGGSGLRFYAGAPLVTPEGIPVGMLCVIDRKPGALTSQQKIMMEALARQVMVQLELRRALREQNSVAQELAKTRQHLDLILDSARDVAIISTSPEGIIKTWNSGAESLFGYKASQIIDRPSSLLFTELDQRSDIPLKERQTAADKGSSISERWYRKNDGTEFFTTSLTHAMLDDKGAILGFTSFSRDTSERKKIEEAMVTAHDKAEAANIAKTEFLANMSHEIRTPMNAIIGLSDILANTQPLTPKQKEFVQTLQTSADSLLALINDLLDIAKIEARTVELEYISFSVTEIMRQIATMMAGKVQEKGVTFNWNAEEFEKKTLLGDPTRLRQIILNLCSNAIKFTEKGNIDVVISSQKDDKTGKDVVSIAVKDTGIGIAADKLQTIFEKFVQADSSINRKYGGTGLGLTITRTLTKIMGGQITVESELGQGSIFTVYIPLEIADNNEVSQDGFKQKILTATFLSARHNVLLVEDYAPNILVATTLLEDFGYSCDVATNGMEAVEKAKTGNYAAVLMDVQMQGMNGLEATALIRDHETNNNKRPLHIIGMTAHALAGDRERCLAAGMDDYLAKPFSAEELKGKLLSCQEAALPSSIKYG